MEEMYLIDYDEEQRKDSYLLEITGLYFEYYNLGGLNFEINGSFICYNNSKKTIASQ